MKLKLVNNFCCRLTPVERLAIRFILEVRFVASIKKFKVNNVHLLINCYCPQTPVFNEQAFDLKTIKMHPLAS